MATQANPAVAAPQTPDIQTRKPLIGFTTTNVPPSQYIFFQDNDWITVTLYVSLGGAFQVTYRYRFLDAHGEVKEGTFVTPPLGTGINGPFTFQIGEGWLLSISVQQSNLVAASEWAWTQIGFTRSNVGLVFQQGFIWEGYVFFNSPAGWPGAPTQGITDGAGFLRSVTGSTPAAGVEISETIPTLKRRQILMMQAQLTTSATVANRQPSISLDDGANPLYNFHSTQNQAASLTFFYDFAPGVPMLFDTLNSVSIPIPQLPILKSGYRIRTSTNGLQVGDQWTALHYLVLEWGTIDV